MKNRYRSLPPEWAGEWDGVTFPTEDLTFPKDLKVEPLPDKTDEFIVSHLQSAALVKQKATSYDTAPGTFCDPEGWFPFINYNYGFALLASPKKVTMVPVEPDTEGVRRVYLKRAHARKLKPTWNGDSVAHWEGASLVVDTIGYNSLSWLGDNREPHSSELHMVERMSLVHNGTYLEVVTEISDPKTLTAPYTLTRYFEKYNSTHLGGGPDRDADEVVCNEDSSPFKQDAQGAVPAASQKK